MQIINFYQNKNKKAFDHTRVQRLIYLFIYLFIYFNALASKDIKTNENDFEII